MKNSIKKLSLLVVGLVVIITSCSKDDGPSVTKATVSYTATEIDATFFQPGNSAPTVNWNGDTGTFQLIESYTHGIQGLTVNETTGEISWTHLLKEGIWTFDIEATNSAGITIVEMTIDNTLQGVFTGTYDDINFFEMEFSKDGTVIVRADDATDPGLASGNWTINSDNEILVNYTYNLSDDQYSTLGTLTQSGAGSSYAGNWYSGHDTGALGGAFSMDIDD